MKIYSGECCICDCGIETNLLDAANKNLRTGDIVVIANRENKSGVMLFHGLSVVVTEQYISFSDGTVTTNPGTHEPFVMGISSININDDENWLVQKVKDCEDVLDGEHWKDYGFCFKK